MEESEGRGRRVHHIAVVVRDLGRSERFYADVLGLPVVKRHFYEDGRPRSIWLELGEGAFLAVELAAEAGGSAVSEVEGRGVKADEAPGWHCVALSIAPSDREAWRARLSSAGYAVFRESPFTLYTRDPDGAIVALSHYPEEILEGGARG